MKTKEKRSPYAQNRIDYIVYSNPGRSRKLLHDYGYEAPKNIHQVVAAIKELVKSKGKKVIKGLILIHPEKELILKETGHGQSYNSFCGACSSNYCGCGSSYDGSLSDLLSEVSNMSVKELESTYQKIKEETKKDPDNISLISKGETIYDELKKRSKNKEQKKDNEEDRTMKTLKIVAPVAIAFFIGWVVGKLS